MRILGLDCSGSLGSVAVLDGGEVLFERMFESPRGRGGALFQALAEARRACGRWERIAVGTGPGSYNGLRTAVAAAEGLKISMKAELSGICSIRAIPCDAASYVAIGDARGGVYYYAKVTGRELQGEFELLDAQALRLRLEGESSIFSPASLGDFPEAVVRCPDAGLLARLAGNTPSAVGGVEPIYLKPAHITKPRARGPVMR